VVGVDLERKEVRCVPAMGSKWRHSTTFLGLPGPKAVCQRINQIN